MHEINRDSIDYSSGGASSGPSWGVYEEYWYDALGRRVLKRSRQQSPICTDSSRCYSSIERIVWDGDNILWEVQQADSGDVQNPSGSGLTGQTGNIGYVSAGGLDAPLGMIRNGTAIVLHRNWKGLVTFATDDSGDSTTCAPDLGTGCDMVSFPGRSWAASLGHPGAVDTEDWYGTVPMGFMGKTGLIYRRNRYYDPSSEQFTQPDPIGMAGGLGVYTYSAGDPVNGSDPYGLCAATGDGAPCIDIPGIVVTAHNNPCADFGPGGVEGQGTEGCNYAYEPGRHRGPFDYAQIVRRDGSRGGVGLGAATGMFDPHAPPQPGTECIADLAVMVASGALDASGIETLGKGLWAGLELTGGIAGDFVAGFLRQPLTGVSSASMEAVGDAVLEANRAAVLSPVVVAVDAGAHGSVSGSSGWDFVPYVATAQAAGRWLGCAAQ